MDNIICISRGCVICEDRDGEMQCVAQDGCNKLDVTDWMDDVPESAIVSDIIEVRFKNTRKGFYRNNTQIPLRKGDLVAVEASPGHDIGLVSLVGELVTEQMKRYGVDPDSSDLKKVYRKARPVDVEKWKESIHLENPTMLKARKIAEALKLDMKIGDVEYQGDKTKAYFYYIADERVDFRELIKRLADEFKVRIEMRQIGARQEAGRIGGVGPCGRELCCSTWLSNFVSVTTNSARHQELSLNPQKLAGQCSKLKCCLNYEVDVYLDAKKDFPKDYEKLELLDGTYFHQKSDIFKKILWYSTAPDSPVNLTPVSVDRVKEIVAINKNGKKAESLQGEEQIQNTQTKPSGFTNAIEEDSITRFDNMRKKKKKKKRNNPQKRHD